MEPLCCWASYMGQFVSVYQYVVSECAPNQRLSSTSQSLAGWPAEGRERAFHEVPEMLLQLPALVATQNL